MYVDKLTLLWDATALSADAVSSSYDTGAAGNDISIGEPLVAVLQVDVAADYTSSNETYRFDVIQDTAADLATAVDILASYIIAYSLLTAGALLVLPIPQGRITKRYIGLSFDGGGTTPTVTVTAWITSAQLVQMTKHYADAVTVS